MLRIVSPHLIEISVVALAVLPQVLSFSSVPLQYRTRIATNQPSNWPKSTVKNIQLNDDDGWGDKLSAVAPEPELGFRDDDRVAKSKVLERLQSDLVAKQNSNDFNTSSAGVGGGEKRDLFIPIFTVVAVVGFAGLYGYEMLRLYSRGELYLPWQ